MIEWPKMCVRCGTRELLIEQRFKWQQMLTPTDGASHDASQSVYMHANIAICRKCKTIGLIRWWISFLIAFVGVAGGGAWTFGAFGDVTLIGLVVLMPSIALFIFLILFRRHVTRFYARFFYMRGYIHYKFRSKKYKEEFQTLNPYGIYLGNI